MDYPMNSMEIQSPDSKAPWESPPLAQLEILAPPSAVSHLTRSDHIWLLYKGSILYTIFIDIYIYTLMYITYNMVSDHIWLHLILLEKPTEQHLKCTVHSCSFDLSLTFRQVGTCSGTVLENRAAAGAASGSKSPTCIKFRRQMPCRPCRLCHIWTIYGPY